MKFFPLVVFPALYRRWDWKLPAAAAATAVLAYLPFLGAGRSVFGFLSGYASEEDLRSGSGFFLWNLVESVAPKVGELGIAPYLALAAAALASLAIHAVARDRSDSHFIVSAMTLAVAAMILLSPHYPWYFVWIVPFLCFAPLPSVLYLTVASPLLYFVPGGPDPEGARTMFEAAIYGPFAVLACLELRRRRAARVGADWIEAQT